MSAYDEGVEITKLALNNDFYIPLKSFKMNKVPHKATVFYGNKEYDQLDDLVEEIYKSRDYSYTEERAKRHIESTIIKAIFNSSKVYGKEISYKFDFIDASNFDIQI